MTLEVRGKDIQMSSNYLCGNLGIYVEFNDDVLRKDLYYWLPTMEVMGDIYDI